MNTDTTVSRRTVLVVAGATGLLAACGSGGSADQGDGTPDGQASSDSSSTGEVLAAVGDVPVGGGAVNTDAHVVVTQPAAGQYLAFSSICTHQGCDVSAVANNVITCGCHGSKFSAESGDVEHGPATGALSAVAVTVQGDNVVRA